MGLFRRERSIKVLRLEPAQEVIFQQPEKELRKRMDDAVEDLETGLENRLSLQSIRREVGVIESLLEEHASDLAPNERREIAARMHFVLNGHTGDLTPEQRRTYGLESESVPFGVYHS